ncbi:TRAP transporter small permease [Virgibacillus ihumii]|uniref:TRAP transporter small permease n=1 Tax=Virgibacillus ihumii TaxID=2686091 RepID=UPI00157DF1AE|nr:TRAP transporter small permease [Virgibacillus ihumii]
MTSLSNGIAKMEKWISIVLVFGLTAVLALSVLFRYFLNNPFSWAGEISIFLFAWISFLGGSLGIKYKSQASLTFVLDKLTEKYRRIVLIVAHILMCIFMVILINYSFQWAFSESVFSQKSNNLQIPMWIPYSSIPIGLSFATIHILSSLIQQFRKVDTT